mmetsp:Transcript_22587/g.45482  ORF Transcript_22587/g.45482 Transcript_22587/m.45482 type:complete len:866 (+) Transcript_22587:145-2742(+)
MSSEEKKLHNTTTASAMEDGDVQIISSASSTSETNNSSNKSTSRESISTSSTGILRMRRKSSRASSGGSGDHPPMSNAESGRSASSPVDDDHPEKQNRKVCMLRGAMIVTLLTATVAVATLVYLYVTRDEERNFQTQYQDSVSKVAEAFQYGIDTKHDAASTFSAIYTSIYGNIVQEVENQKPVWPNATLPFFAEKAKDLLKISNGRALSFNPIITQDVNRLEWEAHATESAWLLGDKSLIVPPPDFTWPNNRTVSFGIYSRDADRNVVYDPGFAPGSIHTVLVPVWQIHPIKTNEKAVMFNLHSEKNRQRALDDMLEYEVPTLTAILQLVQDSETRPSSILFFPVFDNFETPEDFPVFDNVGMPIVNGTNVVGSISIVFSWDTLLQRILPNYIKGMICVLQSSTGQVYSYSVSGNDVTFLGEGDKHDPKYDKYKEVVQATLGNTAEQIGQVDYLITYTLVMYPSQTFENEYVTNRAGIYTAGVVLIFLCTSALFLLYDYLVEDRQQKTARFARQSANIVDAMFPAGFRERLYKSHQNNNSNSGSKANSRRSSDNDEATIKASNRTNGENRSRSQSPSRRRSSTMGRKIVTLQIDKFMKGTRSAPKDHIPTNYSNGDDDKPIADLFLDTSIMFADIVGFTKWSTERSPNEVFTLLERLFWEFDELAAQHNVFKLGTIGDCYIAVTGIPNPIEDHASLLTQFSFAAREKVREVCAQLDAEGLDTLKLDMRFGIHSGAITAGILRGTKSRFELFGDTINTASRMESTSVGGKIQVSAETAELIKLDRRGKWLVKRDGMITAKGKGELQTYWAEPNPVGSRVSFSDEAIDHLPDDDFNKLESQESDRYYQHEYDKQEEKEGLSADEKV